MLVVQRRYSEFSVPNVLVNALSLENSYRTEDRQAVIMILDNVNLDNLPHTWGAASLKARVSRLLDAVKENEMYARWKLDYYTQSSYCNI